jgi:hypothetical protein
VAQNLETRKLIAAFLRGDIHADDHRPVPRPAGTKALARFVLAPTKASNGRSLD